MDLQKNIEFLRRQCQMHDMMLRHVQHLMDVAPHEVLHKQLVDIESSMLLRNDISLASYFPKSAATSSSSGGYIYVLKLQGDEVHDQYYYVGFTQDVNKRLYDHFHGNGAEWTKVHSPVCVLEVVEGDKSDERPKTIEIMKKYGWAKTRGYCWSSKILKSPPRELET